MIVSVLHVGVVGFVVDPPELEELFPLDGFVALLELDDPPEGLATLFELDDVEPPVLGFVALLELDNPLDGLDVLLDPEVFVDGFDFVALEDVEDFESEAVSFFVSDIVVVFSDSATSFLSSVTLTW